MKIICVLIFVLLALMGVWAVREDSYWYITYVSLEAGATGSITLKYKNYYKPRIDETYERLLNRGLKPPIVITGAARMSQSEYQKYEKLVAASTEGRE